MSWDTQMCPRRRREDVCVSVLPRSILFRRTFWTFIRLTITIMHINPIKQQYHILYAQIIILNWITCHTQSIMNELFRFFKKKIAFYYHMSYFMTWLFTQTLIVHPVYSDSKLYSPHLHEGLSSILCSALVNELLLCFDASIAIVLLQTHSVVPQGERLGCGRSVYQNSAGVLDDCEYSDLTSSPDKRSLRARWHNFST